MAAKEISVKKYVVRLSGEEREQLEALISKGKSAAQRLLKARILLKADISEAGEGAQRVDDHSHRNLRQHRAESEQPVHSAEGSPRHQRKHADDGRDVSADYQVRSLSGRR